MTKHEARFLSTDAAATTVDDRRVMLALSSTVPVNRGGYIEVLEHSKAAIDLTWLASGRAPLLLDHDQRKQIGVIESVSLDESVGVLRATVRLGQGAPEAEGVLIDIRDGVRSNVSIGYTIQRAEERNGQTVITRWMPIEASIVSIPADMTVGVGRAADPALGDDNRRIHVAVTTQTQTLSARDAAEIASLGHRHGMAEAAHKAVEAGTSLTDFRQHVLSNLPTGTRLESRAEPQTNHHESFDLGRFLRGKVSGDWRGAEFERETSSEMTRAARGVRGSVVPTDAMGTRAAMTTGGVAAPLQAIDHRGDLFVDALRPASWAVQAGATFITGLTSDVSIPKETAAPIASWVAESGAVTEGNPTYGSISMQATMLSARVSMTRKALLQGIPAMDGLLKRSINRQFAAALDKAAISGSGVGVIPAGIEATVGINAFAAALAGTVTWAEITRAWKEVASDDVPPDGSMAWVMHPTVAKILRDKEKFAGSSGEPILGDATDLRDDSILAGTIMGRPAFETSHATSSVLTFGRMSDVLIGQFGGIDFVVDEVTGAANGEVTIYAFGFFDIAVRHAQSFCKITGI